MILTGENELLREKPVTVPLCLPQMPRGLACGQTRSFVVRVRRLTARTVVQPSTVSNCTFIIECSEYYLQSCIYLHLFEPLRAKGAEGSHI
jgi:hypothetical protein